MIKIIIALFLLSAPFVGVAQKAQTLKQADNKAYTEGIVKEQLEYLDSLYLYSTSAWRDVVNGRDYIRYFFRSTDKPLLRSEEGRKASLIFNNRKYEDLPLQYDTYTGEVVYTDNKLILNNKICEVALNSDNISRFDLYFRHDTMIFKNFRNEPAFNLEEGFYEVVHDGECKYIIRHISTLYLSDGLEKYPYAPESYIRVGDQYVKTVSTAQFLQLFGDKSDEIIQFMRRKKIRLRKADKHQITDILKFYERLHVQAG
ncbi:MAG TPA: hypothetical protein VLQ76_03585 [Bacteroidales bacterium]|nr:hypothetical protein [Bacteroidales bacterium]